MSGSISGSMSASLLTPPALEPVSVTEAKAFLRVEHDDDDALIGDLIASARTHVESLTRRALIAQTWRLTFDAWPRGGRIVVTPCPVIELEAARVLDADGTPAAIDPQSFVLNAEASAFVFPLWSMPIPGRTVAGIELDVVCGYGNAADEVPQPLRMAIRLRAAHWYEHRGVVATEGGVQEMPANVAALVAPYRVLSL